ncbi:type II toxin-antitoxin system HigB family toxin [Polynucleobacter sp. 86C-FISCH]|uniref:type II toxin-antitoxin system HigB family toxin n=1 Tax=Polynucleobacter sp. 86C-FISCH TaxID=2689101 RepID=UPI001C0C6CAF|nr:type II toxin-antitoxin system HigB family toxin [Polynucleobacter sp. 86C-FISCH]
MRVIARKHLINFWRIHPDAEQPLKAWYDEVTHLTWKKPQDIKNQYRSASFIAHNRVVFNIKGNAYRLVVAVAYSFGAVYVKFIGSHAAYDRIDACTVQLEEK